MSGSTLFFLAGCCLVGLAAAGCRSAGPFPPVAKTVPTRLEHHGKVRIDEYYWLKRRDDPEVLAYLEAENAHTRAVMAPTEPLQDRLFEEIRGRIKQTDLSVPYRRDGDYYYTRLEDGREYPIHCRKRGTLDAPEEVMLDVNEMAAGRDYIRVTGLEVSPERNLLAYAVDHQGRRIYTIRFKNLDTGETLDDSIPNVTANSAWANDNRTLFYAKQDPRTLRSYRIYRHVLGTPASQDQLVYEEADETFHCFVFKTKSKRFLLIGSSQTLSDEYRYLDADDPRGSWRILQPRERGLEYGVDHHGDHFYIRTNLDAENFRLVRAPVDRPGKESWENVVSHREEVLLGDFEIFDDHLVLEERKDGLIQLRVRPWNGGGEHLLDFGEPAYVAYLENNWASDTRTLRYVYSSLTTPASVYDYDMVTREKTLRKRTEVLGPFDPSDYRSERLHAKADDGTLVPISLVYRKDARRPEGNPVLLYGYGSYGYSLDASFSSPRLSLLDRGFVFAIAHVRGGQELGRWWYEQGKLLDKKNTFTDFIACAEHLIERGYARHDRLYALGRSAGGLLMGAVVNMRPDLFHGVIAGVPFVDVVTTMLDDSIPLTTAEYDEWGDPNDEEYFDYILSYSPYDNVRAKAYPNLLVLAGLHDSQVQFWEPAKWVAKIRTKNTGDGVVLLKTEMEAGHGGPSGRYRQYREIALQYAFLLDLAGLTGVDPRP